jgi:hypothetical protein
MKKERKNEKGTGHLKGGRNQSQRERHERGIEKEYTHEV